MSTPKKHVIVLGAGASITSGYPTANDLTVLMCDRQTFLTALREVLIQEGEEDHEQVCRNSKITQYFDSFRNATARLRNGDFATMDELSRLASGGQHANEISQLKKLMRLVFALNRPDIWHYADSDYRLLIQKLFIGSNRLRDDVSILSFNYDPYFEFRLCRAFLNRQAVRSHNEKEHEQRKLAITSGFLNPHDLQWLDHSGFCHLKLHGGCVFPGAPGQFRKMLPVQPGDNPRLSAFDLFGDFPTVARLAALVNSPFSDQEPPAILPWEIISDDGRLLEQKEFESLVGDNWQHRSLYPLFSGLWYRAKREIEEADKISFVGLSFGPFMKPEFKFLFRDKKNIFEVVVANPEHKNFTNYADPYHPRTLCGRLLDILYEISPQLSCNRSNAGVEKAPRRPWTAGNSTRDANEITARHDFGDFLQHDL